MTRATVFIYDEGSSVLSPLRSHEWAPIYPAIAKYLKLKPGRNRLLVRLAKRPSRLYAVNYNGNCVAIRLVDKPRGGRQLTVCNEVFQRRTGIEPPQGDEKIYLIVKNEG